MKYDVEVGASNSLKFQANSLSYILANLRECRGRVSIVDKQVNQEVFYGPVEQACEMIEVLIAGGHQEFATY